MKSLLDRSRVNARMQDAAQGDRLAVFLLRDHHLSALHMRNLHQHLLDVAWIDEDLSGLYSLSDPTFQETDVAHKAIG
jgi:hypothetical protein